MKLALVMLSACVAIAPTVAGAADVTIDLNAIDGPDPVDVIAEGEYTVCHVSNIHKHRGTASANDFPQLHLRKDDIIKVTTDGIFGKVILAKDDLYRETKVPLIGDARALVGVASLKHKDTSGNGPVDSQPHLIVLTLVENEHVADKFPFGQRPEGCPGITGQPGETKKGDLLGITFCWEVSPAATGHGWRCREPGRHLGHVHAEN